MRLTSVYKAFAKAMEQMMIPGFGMETREVKQKGQRWPDMRLTSVYKAFAKLFGVIRETKAIKKAMDRIQWIK